MKKLLIMVGFLVMCWPSVYAYDDSYGENYARLSYVSGDVFIQRAGDLGYQEGMVNLPLAEGEKLGTRDGRAEVSLGRRNYLRIDKDSQIELALLPQDGRGSISIHILAGSVYLRINSLDREKDIEVHSPDASFYVLSEGLYRLDVRGSRETVLSVIEGQMEAAGEEGSRLVARGGSLVASNGLFMSGSQGTYASYDQGFYDWNRSRDEFYARRVYRTYMPVELYDYEVELAYYGRWIYEQPYGYVWVPTVYHSSWRPYYNGRWVWYPIIGWTWVSYDPWGWCVSHYGRWHWRLGMGWYWIPTRVWGAAWVHWYDAYDYIGWCPLSYYNRPVIIVNNIFYGNGYSGYYPANSSALTVIQKNQLQAPNISRVALSQNNASRLSKISLSQRQPAVRNTVDRSSVVAVRASQVLNRTDIRPVDKTAISRRSVRSSEGPVGRNGGDSPIRQVPDSSLSRVRDSGRVEAPSDRDSRFRQETPDNSSRDIRSSPVSSTPSTGIKRYPSEGTTSRTSAPNPPQVRTFTPDLRRDSQVSTASPSGSLTIKKYGSSAGSSVHDTRYVNPREERIPPSASPSGSLTVRPIREYGSQDIPAADRRSAPSDQVRSYSPPSTSDNRYTRPTSPQASPGSSSSVRYPSRYESPSSSDFSRSSSSSSTGYRPSVVRSTPSWAPMSPSSSSRSSSSVRSYSSPSRSSSPPTSSYSSPSRSSSPPSRSYSSPSRSSSSSKSSTRSSSRSSSSGSSSSRVKKK